MSGVLSRFRNALSMPSTLEAESEHSEKALMERLAQRSFSDFCAERLAALRESKQIPRLAMYQVLDNDLQSKKYVTEVAWRAVLKEAGWSRTASALTATVLLSKQPRIDKVGFGAVCPESQLFNHIPGQQEMTDKAKVLATLRRAATRALRGGERSFILDDFMQPTIVFRAGVPSTLHDSNAYAKFERELLASEKTLTAMQQQQVAWVRKQPNVENSKGVTPSTWKSLREKHAALGSSGFQAFFGSSILQKYMSDPMLVRGRKTDLRCFVLVSSVRPFAAFFYSDFVARTSPKAYSRNATDVGAFTVGVHLAHGQNFKASPQDNQWTPEALARELKSSGAISARSADHWLHHVFRPQLKNLTSRLLWAAEPTLSKAGGHFAVFGLDVLVDSKLRCWFSEMNYSPDLSDGTSSVYKIQMQREMLGAAFALQEEVLSSRSFGGGDPLVTRLIRAAKEKKRLPWRSPRRAELRAPGRFEPVAMSDSANPEQIHWYHDGARWH